MAADTAALQLSLFTQPIFSSILSRRNFLRAILNCVWQTARLAIIRQLFGKSFRQTIPEIDALYAALLQETGARPPLRGPRNFACTNYHIRLYGVRETHIGSDSALRCSRTPQRGVPTNRCQFHTCAVCRQFIPQSSMDLFVDLYRLLG